MIDLHTHSFLSDGSLIPSELLRRAEHKGIEALAITDHVDASNVDFVVPRLVEVCRACARHMEIRPIPGAEITHASPETIPGLAEQARELGAADFVLKPFSDFEMTGHVVMLALERSNRWLDVIQKSPSEPWQEVSLK